MARSSDQVVVTGAGAVCALGHDCAEIVRAIQEGRTGIAPIRRFDTSDFSVHLGAEVKGWPAAEGASDASAESRLCAGFALTAAREAIAHAGLQRPSAPPGRRAVVFGTNLGEVGRPVHELAVGLAAQLGFAGPVLTICTACSSSTGAIGLARDLVRAGVADIVLAGGSDVLTPRVFAGFHALGVLSREPCAPFSTPFGTTLGEGAGFVVLERDGPARGRGAEPLVAVTGWGLSADGYHETSPDPRGRGVARAVGDAVDDAGLLPGDVGYVNAHGSGTAANDPSEWSGIRRGLGGCDDVPVSSTKGALGHAQGAAGALEAITTLVLMRRGLAPPTLHFNGARHHAPRDPVAGPLPRPLRYDHAVSVNSAFGGANAAVVLSAVSTTSRRIRARRSVEIVGVGVVSRCGLGADAWSARPRSSRNGDGRVPDFSFRDVDPRIDPRGLDPSSRFLTAASALALQQAGLARDRETRFGTGLVLGSVRPSPRSLAAFGDSIAERGLPGVSAPAFARIVLNAPAGFCSKLLDLRGPLTALTVGRGSGLAAIVLAAELLSTRPGVRLMLGAGTDELDPGTDGSGTVGEGAVSVALAPSVEGPASASPSVGRSPSASPSTGVGTDPVTRAPRLTSWGIAGPGRLTEAQDQAMARRPGGAIGVDEVFDEAHYGAPVAGAGALPSALAFVDAVAALRAGAAERALVTSACGDAVSLAVLLEV